MDLEKHNLAEDYTTINWPEKIWVWISQQRWTYMVGESLVCPSAPPLSTYMHNTPRIAPFCPYEIAEGINKHKYYRNLSELLSAESIHYGNSCTVWSVPNDELIITCKQSVFNASIDTQWIIHDEKFKLWSSSRQAEKTNLNADSRFR